jgi:ferredoxin
LAENILKGDNNQGVAVVPEELYEDLENAYHGCPADSIKVANKPFDGNPYKHDNEE